jgi:hypothetical protein
MEGGGKSPQILNPALDGGESSASRTSLFILRESESGHLEDQAGDERIILRRILGTEVVKMAGGWGS